MGDAQVVKANGSFILAAWRDVHFRVFACILVAKLLFFYYITLSIIPRLPSIGLFLALLCLSLFFRGRLPKLAYLVALDLVLSLIFFINSLHYRFFGDFASVYELRNVHLLFGPATRGLLSFIDREAVFLLDIPFLPFLAWRLGRTKNPVRPGLVRGLSFIALVGLLLHAPLLRFITDDNFTFRAVVDRPILVRLMGVIDYQALDIFNYMAAEIGKAQVSPDDVRSVERWFDNGQSKNADGNRLTGAGKGMNLIIIQVESMQNFVIGRKWNGQEITPNLNRLAEGGIRFTNIYDQTAAGNSSDAAFLANCSLYPSSVGAVSFLHQDNRFDSLPGVLGEDGYSTATMHAYRKTFWNRDKFEKTMGFEHQFYSEAYLMTDRLGWGLSDKAFFIQSAKKLTSFSEPFYAFLATLTSHAPFDYVTSKEDGFPLGDVEGASIGNYVRIMHYVDSAIGLFLDRLTEQGLASRSVVVIYGDHRARFLMDDLRRIGVDEAEELKKVPLIISIPNSSKPPTVGDPVGGLIDVAPTVLNILGVESSEAFFLGSDLAGPDDEGFVVFRNGSFVGSPRVPAAEYLMISDLIIEKDAIALIRQ